MAVLRYEVLANDLAAMIEQGVLRQGDRLPSVRALAADRRLSVSTVVQALRQLEQGGLVEARPQSGYFVRQRPVVGAPLSRSTPQLACAVDISAKVVHMLQTGLQPGLAPLAAALPAADLLPVAALRRLYGQVVRRHPQLLDGSSYLKMNEAALLRQLVRYSLSWGGGLEMDELVVTNSCTEALSLCLRAVCKPGDTVAVESPAYYLMLQLLETLGLRALEIPCDPRGGMSVEALELALRQGSVQVCLLAPNASNPLGSIMPDENKRRLAALTVAHDVPVIEDDIYGDLCFTRERPWPIKAFDQAGNVMLCSSFSKSLSPSLRLGFVAAGRYRNAIRLHKTISSGSSNPVSQMVLAEYLASGKHERHLRQLRRSYAAQIDAMRLAVSRYFPAGTRMTEPQGGFVLWVELPEEIDTSRIYDAAIAAHVAYVPGELFSASGMYRNCLRLNCGNPHNAEIEAAVARLGAIVSECLGG